MISSPVCILYTQDQDFVRRVKAFLRTLAHLRHVADGDRLDAVLQQNSPALLMFDLRAKESRDLIEQVQTDWPEVLIIALGTPRSEPLRDAEQFGIYAAEDLELERPRFQALVGRAFDYLKIAQENRDLREESAPLPARHISRRVEPVQDRQSQSSLPQLRFPRVFRRFENVDALLANVVEGVAEASGVTRVGLFSRIREGDRYRLRAGLRCLPETEEIEFGERDGLIRWFERNARLISRENLAHSSDRALLRRALDTFGAEVIVPLYTRSRIIGWIFFGHRITGRGFNDQDLEGLMVLADHVSTVLENALLQEETTRQKTLAETLLKSIPPGIVAIDEGGIIRWFNPPAEEILGLPAKKVLHKTAEAAGPLLATFLRETLEAETNLPLRNWIDNNTRRSLAVETRRLADEQTRLGAVAVIQDLTSEENLRQKESLLDRAAFWADLAASMSHEIRNPLVAIKTFAQLLPERFDDADFRKEFNHIVVGEIDRLDRIITQINNFAHPPDLVFKAIDVRSSVKKGVEIARSRFGVNGDVALDTSLPNDLPRVLGDETALAEMFAHLLANAAEALSGKTKPRITLSAKPVRDGKRPSGVVITVHDNGKGIAPEIKEKVFSPFCTTKARGMGLGLPIVKRTVFDHHGRVDIESNSRGTTVNVMLPTKPARD
jgi:PAS domain S-box-containing protein